MSFLVKRENSYKEFDCPPAKRIAQNLFNTLPSELIVEIMKYLPIKDREAFSLTSKRIYDCTYYAKVPETAKIFHQRFFNDIIQGRIHNVKNFIDECGIDPSCENNRAIAKATKNNQLDIVRLLLEDDRVYPEEEDGIEANRPLEHAAKNGNIQIIELLLTDPRVLPESESKTTILLAAVNRHLEALELLLKDGRSNPEDGLAIYTAADKDYPEIVQALLKDDRVSGIEVGFEGFSVLSMAAKNGRLEIVKIILNKHQLQTLPIDHENNDALELAAENGHLEIVKLLAEICVFAQKNAMKNAIRKGHKEVVRFLLPIVQIPESNFI